MTRSAPSRRLALLAASAAAIVLTLTGMTPASAATPPTAPDSSQVVNYVNLGDSYSAGFGSGSLVSGPFPGCLQGSGPSHVTQIASTENVNLLANAACAGLGTAEIAGVIGAIGGQLGAADLVTLSLGANDLNIRGLQTFCSTPGMDIACDQALAAGAQLIPTVGASAHQTLALLDASTSGHILVLDYPRLFTASAGDQPLLSAARARDLNALGDSLNKAIRNATRGTSASFISVQGRFNNHGLGSTDPWIYFNAANLNDPFNLHPTTTGYLQGYYPAVRSYLNRLLP